MKIEKEKKIKKEWENKHKSISNHLYVKHIIGFLLGWNAEQPGRACSWFIDDSSFLGLYAPSPILKQDIMLVHFFTNIYVVPPPKISQPRRCLHLIGYIINLRRTNGLRFCYLYISYGVFYLAPLFFFFYLYNYTVNWTIFYDSVRLIIVSTYGKS